MVAPVAIQGRSACDLWTRIINKITSMASALTHAHERSAKDIVVRLTWRGASHRVDFAARLVIIIADRRAIIKDGASRREHTIVLVHEVITCT